MLLRLDARSTLTDLHWVYEQHLVPEEIKILIGGLERINERGLADEFQRGFDVLKAMASTNT